MPVGHFIFVFESSLHADEKPKGSARIAANHFGRDATVFEGSSGSSYAIPCRSVESQPLEHSTIKESIERFLDYAKSHPEDCFWVAKIGTDHGIFSVSQIAGLFTFSPRNVCLPSAWREHVMARRQLTIDL
jgi:hypothetical protein